MNFMFYRAKSFDKNISKWDIQFSENQKNLVYILDLNSKVIINQNGNKHKIMYEKHIL